MAFAPDRPAAQRRAFEGFFAEPGRRPCPGTIAAAVAAGQVLRHRDPGHIWVSGMGCMSASDAIGQGLIDSAAALYIQQQRACTDAAS